MNRLQFLGLALALLLPTSASAQQPEVVLDFTASETFDGSSASPRYFHVSRAEDGHYFVTPTTRGVWAEFDETGTLVGFRGKQWTDRAPGQYRGSFIVLPLQGDTLLVIEERGRVVWTTRDNEYIAARALQLGGVTAATRLDDGRVMITGVFVNNVRWAYLNGPGDVEQFSWTTPEEELGGGAPYGNGPQPLPDGNIWLSNRLFDTSSLELGEWAEEDVWWTIRSNSGLLYEHYDYDDGIKAVMGSGTTRYFLVDRTKNEWGAVHRIEIFRFR